MAVDVKEVSIKTYNNIGKVEQRYTLLRRAYDIL
jgi:hypothetical protein